MAISKRMSIGYRVTLAAGWVCLVIQAASQVAGVLPTVTEPYFFRTPELREYRVEPKPQVALRSAPAAQWIRAWPATGSAAAPLEFGDRVVLQLEDSTRLAEVLSQTSLELARTVAPGVFILQAADAWSALGGAQKLAIRPGVRLAHPVRRLKGQRHGSYSPYPKEPYFPQQWYLENRDSSTGARLGVDLNVRGAWAYTQGEGVFVAIVDNGVQLDHPEFKDRQAPSLHYNFYSRTTNGFPATDNDLHGTAVAGLLLATGTNEVGMSGAAPAAQFGSCIIWGPNSFLADEVALMDMFQYRSNLLGVQNHSWGNATVQPLAVGLLEQIGISNAILHGRSGLGVVMVRSGGNGRENMQMANDDGYLTMPFVIPVSAVASGGRALGYSNPGANILVAAPSGDNFDKDLPGLFTTDLTGTRGTNATVYTNDFADYRFGLGPVGFTGTSASAPLISGVVALMLSANPRLGYRDVQQILVFSARHFDWADPDLATNSAGFVFSHNDGFGVPDAGLAVQLARQWPNRPPVASLSATQTVTRSIPDHGLTWLASGGDGQWTNLVVQDGFGPRPAATTAELPMVYVGLATNAISQSLTGKVALIQRGVNYFYEKINLAAQAGAALAIVFNDVNQTEIINMGFSEYGRIPACFIGQLDGEALRDRLAAGKPVTAKLVVNPVAYDFDVTNTLILEHVQVAVDWVHPRRGDVRIQLTPPRGAGSILQRAGLDDSPAWSPWTFCSARHFFESSAGHWQVRFLDEAAGNTGRVNSVTLIFNGVTIADADHDGLPDEWETAHFGNLNQTATDDPDRDGLNNLREYILGSNPQQEERPLRLDAVAWNDEVYRLSWPASGTHAYGLARSAAVTGPYQVVTNLPGLYPELEWFVPHSVTTNAFFGVRQGDR